MIAINEPTSKFRDFDKLIYHMAIMETDLRRVHCMPKGDTSVRSASQQASVHVFHPEYLLDIYFTSEYMTIMESAYRIINTTLIKSSDIEGYELDDYRLTFYLKDGKEYGLPSNALTIDFYKIEDSTPEIVNRDNVKKHLSLGRRACYGIPA